MIDRLINPVVAVPVDPTETSLDILGKELSPHPPL